MRTVEVLGPRGLRLRCAVAQRRRDRVRGLRGRDRLEPGEGLLLPGTTSVHTFGMGFPILVARLDDTFAVVDVRSVPPRRVLVPHGRARHVLECATGVDLRDGDRLWSAQAGQPPRPAAPVTTHEPA